MSIKLIATDMDGTIMMDDHLAIHPKTIEAFKAAKKAGIKTAISTGRAYRLADREAVKFDGFDYIIASNGAVVVDGNTMEIISHNYIPNDVARQIVEIFEEYDFGYVIYADLTSYITPFTYKYLEKVTTLPHKFLMDYRERMEIVEDMLVDVMDKSKIEKINVDEMPEAVAKEVMERIKDIPDLVFTAGFKGNLEITSKGSDKGSALKWLAEEVLGIGAENVMAFGDSGNDATMLEYAEESYAMLNGNDKAKGIAKHITRKSNEEDGVGFEISYYLTNL